MPAPYDYTIEGVQNPAQSFLQGIQMVDALRKREQDMALAQANAAAAQKKQEFMQGFMGKIASGTAKPEDYQQALLIDPANEKALTAGLGALNTARKDTAFGNMAPVFGGIALGTPAGIQAARNALSTQLAAATNTGEQNKASAIEAQLKMLDTPEGQNILMAQAGMGLNTIDPERFGKLNETVLKQRAAPIEERKALAEAGKAESDAQKAAVDAQFAQQMAQAGLNEKTWNITNLRSQIRDRAERLNLERTKVNAEVTAKLAEMGSKLTELPESAQKLVNESATIAASSKADAARMNELAVNLESLGGGWGKFTSATEWAKAQYGGQDFKSAVLGEYTRLANSAAIKAYRASGATGGFSDTDLQTALSGIPPYTASPKQLASFMRGMAKMQDMDAALNNAKTDWLTENKGQLGRSRQTFIAGDYSVKPGETYSDFSTRVSADIAKRYGPKPSMVDLIPTAQPLMRPGLSTPTQPAAPVRNIRADADAILRGGQ